MQRIAETYRLPNRDFRNPDRQPDDVDLLRALRESCLEDLGLWIRWICRGFPQSTAYTCAKPPSTNNSVPVM